MSQRGFTLIEILIAITLFALVFGIGYGMLLALEQLHQENEMYFQLIQVMQIEINNWRNFIDLEDATFSMNQISVIRDVEQYMYKPNMERLEASYHWQVNKKLFHVDWQIDRFVPSSIGSTTEEK